MKFSSRLMAFVFTVFLAASAFAQVTVVFARHAEKGATPAEDPVLTEAGKRRAEALASLLADSGVEAIYATELQRTQQTAAPLAARVGLKPIILPAKDTNALVQAIRARHSGVVVVVGHSNTLPDIISALGGPKVEIADSQYDNLFILTVGPSHSSLLRLHYGDPSPSATGAMPDGMMTPPKN